ncbi:hypothetical protein EDC96DRAFT_527352 [Choanephora cucurbitarum]|nr:hypothetical protein EDC96DRAFT_527352 [Choanephora cucurbitarum]
MPSLLSLPLLAYSTVFVSRAFITKLCTRNCLHLAILLCIRRIAILTHIFQGMHSSLYFFTTLTLCICIPAYRSVPAMDSCWSSL